MFSFPRRARANSQIVGAPYAQIVAAARQPVFFSRFNAPDTPLGRFEMIALHMILFLRRASAGDATTRAIAQEVVDVFFTEVDHSIRELGVGDQGVPKRMKKLAKMFYGRAQSYGEALDAGDEEMLAAALARNIAPDGAPLDANALARHALAAASLLAATPDDALRQGRPEFPLYEVAT